MELFDLGLWAGPAAAVVAVAGSLAARHLAPLLLGILGLPLGGVAGRYLWEWFAERPPYVDFGSEFEGYDWLIGFAFVGALLGAVAGTVWALRRRARRAES